MNTTDRAPWCYEPQTSVEPGPTKLRSYAFDLTCPVCARQTLEHVAPGRSDAITTRAVLRCTSCHRSYLITVAIEPLRPLCDKALKR